MVFNTNRSPRARVIGAELRKARMERAVGVRELARRLGMDHSKLSRCETGYTVPTSEHVASVLTALGVSETERDRVVELARGSERTNWLAPGVPSAHHELTTLIEFERSATQITEVSASIFPGLLQTSSYARAAMGAISEAEINKALTLRLGRRGVLKGKNAPHFTALIMETGLRTPIGGHRVLAEQLRHVITLSAWPSVTVQVIPADLETWHAAHMGGYVLFEFPKGAPIVHLEHYSSAVFLHESADTAAYRSASDTLRSLAMTPEESVGLIARAVEEMEGEG